MARLTKSFVEKLVPPSKEYELHWDEQDRGFGLRITSAGKRTYIAQGRINGKTIRITIGSHDPWTCDNARKEARDLIMSMDKGIDPRDMQKEEAILKITLREVANHYLRDRPLKERSRNEIERHVTTTFSSWQNKPLASISRDAVTARFNEMKTLGLHGNRPAPAQANQGFSVLRALFNYAIREYRKPCGSPVITDNPCDVLFKKWAQVKPRTTRIPDTKIGAVWHMLSHLKQKTTNVETLASIDLVMFLILTGARIGEASALTWDRVNLEEKWWHIPDPKNSNPVWLPLSNESCMMLSARHESKTSNFVFASWSKTGHLVDVRGIMKKVSESCGEELSAHDLRRSFTTIGIAKCKIELHKIELLTNHVPRGVTARHYLETSRLTYLMPEVQQIADFITNEARIAEAILTGQNVVQLKQPSQNK